MAVKEVLRAYLVDEDDQVHRFPQPRYVRVLRREERMPMFARKTIRFVESVYGVENGAIVYALAHFPLISFDANGRRDKVHLHTEQQPTGEEAAALRRMNGDCSIWRSVWPRSAGNRPRLCSRDWKGAFHSCARRIVVSQGDTATSAHPTLPGICFPSIHSPSVNIRQPSAIGWQLNHARFSSHSLAIHN
jgi:hypothetical protein